jgi:ferredoxin
VAGAQQQHRARQQLEMVPLPWSHKQQGCMPLVSHASAAAGCAACGNCVEAHWLL